MRQTPLSSMATQPRSRAATAMSRLIRSVAEMKAMSDSSKTSGVVSSTAILSPANVSSRPYGPRRRGQPQARHGEAAFREDGERDRAHGPGGVDDHGLWDRP